MWKHWEQNWLLFKWLSVEFLNLKFLHELLIWKLFLVKMNAGEGVIFQTKPAFPSTASINSFAISNITSNNHDKLFVIKWFGNY